MPPYEPTHERTMKTDQKETGTIVLTGSSSRTRAKIASALRKAWGKEAKGNQGLSIAACNEVIIISDIPKEKIPSIETAMQTAFSKIISNNTIDLYSHTHPTNW